MSRRPPIRMLFVVQGEGRGHMTQAITLARIIQQTKHEIAGCVVSLPKGGKAPDFFLEEFRGDVDVIDSPALIIDTDKRGIDWRNTIVQGGRKLTPDWARSVRRLRKIIRRVKPDLIVNFYEPTAAILSLYTRNKVPTIAIAHQFMFLHDRYPKPTGHTVEQQFIDWYTNLIGRGASRALALSLYPATGLNDKRLRVVPPLVRDDILRLQPRGNAKPFFLVYLSRPDLLTELVNWHRQYPDVHVQCYRHDPTEPKVIQLSDTLTVHQLDNNTFIQKMADCAGMATTAGFETTSEALYLGKPILMIPMHLEQKCNAIDAALMDAAIIGTRFWLDRLLHFSQRYSFSNDEFRQWVQSADQVFVDEIERSVYGSVDSHPERTAFA